MITSCVLACVGCFVGFVLCRDAVGGKYLDEVCSLQKAQVLVEGLSHRQTKNHLLVTYFLDNAFPVCYGLGLAGFALRAIPLAGVWSSLPALLAVLSDFCENGTHVIALKKGTVPRSKPMFSILKWVFIGVAVAWPLVSLLRGN